MKFRHRFPLLALALLAACSLSAAQAARDSTNGLKLLKSPTVPVPEEALKKNIEGKVTLSFVVDANGHVSDVEAINGPPELFQAAIDSVKQWEFEPPANAPVRTTASISYGHPRPCPGPESDMGTEWVTSPLKSHRGTTVDFDNSVDAPMPRYFVKERKAGIAGEMVLAIVVNPQGKVTKVRVVRSLSPHLDKAAAKSVRTWRFTLRDGSPGFLPDTFDVRITYEAMCNMDL